MTGAQRIPLPPHFTQGKFLLGRAGFTLVELFVAMALFAIIAGMAYSFFLFANRETSSRERASFKFDNSLSLLESITANIRDCRGTVSLAPERWVFIKRNGDTATYQFVDDTLRYRSLALTVGGKPVLGFAFTALGNDSLLDVNGDHEVTMNELDLNGNNRIDGFETENIAWIRVALKCKADAPDSLVAVEAVKNNLECSEGESQTYF
jgi:prepilin-type N-terminal cleavage/methylation domain-containing protein